MADNTKKRKVNKIRRAASNVILVCLIGIFLVSGFSIIKIIRSYMADRAAYNTVAETAGAEKWDGNIDFNALKKVNKDIIGWVYLEGTAINYPIVQTDNNDDYLHILFDGTYGAAGTLFADCNTKKPFKQFNTIVYGHHMKDGSMFGGFKKYTSSDYAKKKPRFEIITPDGKYHMEVWAFLNQPADSKLYTNNVSEENADDYIKWISDNASYTTSVNVDRNDKLVALSTCAYEYDNARYVIVGKLVPWGQE